MVDGALIARVRVPVLEHRPCSFHGRQRAGRPDVDRVHPEAVQSAGGDVHGRPDDAAEVPEAEQRAVEPLFGERRRHRPGRAAAERGHRRELRAGDGAGRDRGGGAVPVLAEALERAGNGQSRVRPDDDNALDAGDRLQPRGERRDRRGRPRPGRGRPGRFADGLAVGGLDMDGLAGALGLLVRELAGQHVDYGSGAEPGLVHGVLGGDRNHGRGGDEQGKHQAADGAEGGPRVVGQATGGDQRGRAVASRAITRAATMVSHGPATTRPTMIRR